MLYIFDMDGTLVFQDGSGMKAKDLRPELMTLLPGVAETCQSLVEAGHILSIASNQGGVAFGFLMLAQADARVAWVAQLIGAQFYELCPYHPDGIVSPYCQEANCRKPNPGMIQTLQARTGVPWNEIVMVGNEFSDFQAAMNAGVQFVWATDFF